MKKNQVNQKTFIDKLIFCFYEGKNIDQQYKDAVSFILLSVIGSFIMLSYSLIHIFKYKLLTLGCIYIASALFLIIQLFISKIFQNYKLLFAIGISTYNIPIFCAAYYIGAGQSPVIFWCIVLLVVSKMFGSKNAVVMTSLFSLVGVVTIGYLSYNGIYYERNVFSNEGLIIYRHLQVVIIACVILTVTQIHRKLLDTSYSELEIKNDQINQFIRILCHDIANPLTVVVARSKIGMGRYYSEEKQKKSFSEINRAGILVSSILDEVRVFEAINTGKIGVKLDPVDVSLLLEDIEFLFQDKLKEKNITLLIRGAKKIKSKVLCDKESFKNHVLSNLVSNAIKFSKSGATIEIFVGSENESVYFEIRDQGIGIPQDLLENLFEIGEKTTRLGTLGERGTGLGLPLVKTYIDQYNGSISIDTREEKDFPKDHGTSFRVHLSTAA